MKLHLQGFIKKLLSVALIGAVVFTFSACGYFGESGAPQPHLIPLSEANESRVLPIDSRESAEFVQIGQGDPLSQQLDELIEIVSHNDKKPLFNNPALDPKVKRSYERAEQILKRYIKGDFTDFEKVHAIYDYLTYYISYDQELFDKAQNGGSVNGDESFELSGVLLNGKAVCDGFATAFRLLSEMEGIKAIEIEGEYIDTNSNMIAHKWNKVKLGDIWYNVDPTMGSYSFRAEKGKDIKLVHHGYLLISDAAIESSAGRHSIDISTNPYPSLYNYDTYSDLTFELGGEQVSMTVNSKEELLEVFDKVKKAKRSVGKIELKLNYGAENSDNIPTAFGHDVYEAYGRVTDKSFVCNPPSETNAGQPFVRFPGGVFLFVIYK